MSIAIKVENLSKAYQLGEIGTGTLSRDASTELSMTISPSPRHPELVEGLSKERRPKYTNPQIPK